MTGFLRSMALLLVLGAAALSFSASASGQVSAGPSPIGARQALSPQLEQPIEIVVKFKDDNLVKPIVDLFWKDPAAARTAFDAFKKGHPALTRASLARVTYSNELVLAYACSAVSCADRPAAIRALVAALASSVDIAYADPEVMVKPGKVDR